MVPGQIGILQKEIDMRNMFFQKAGWPLLEVSVSKTAAGTFGDGDGAAGTDCESRVLFTAEGPILAKIPSAFISMLD